MKIVNMRSIGFVVIIIGIMLFIYAGQVEVNASEEGELRLRENAPRSSINWYAAEWEDYHEEITRDVTDANMLASWLSGLSQLLVFAGIGFILYDVATKGGSVG